MDRRQFLKSAGVISAGVGAGLILDRTVESQRVAAVDVGSSTIAELRAAIQGAVLVPGEPEYAARSHDFNRRVPASPAVIALCRSARDVMQCMDWARRHGVRISMRSGGHSYEGFSLGPGIVIDVSAVNAVAVDQASNTATIGAGARLGDVYRELSKYGVTIPGGACPTVGLAGLALGGGFGLLSRQWGLTADNLLSLDIVDASGRLLKANPGQHPDLFWVCRGGGGGSFGIATSLTLRVHPIREVSLYETHWPIAEAKRVIQAWQEWAPYAPDALTSEFVIAGALPTCKSAGQFVGSEADLRKALQPLLNVGSPVVKLWTAPFLDAVSYFAGPEATRPVYLKAKSDYATAPLSPKAIDALLANLGNLVGAASGWVQLDSYGGAINRVPADATAFVHRAGTLFSIQYNAIWEKPDETPAAVQWIRSLYAAMRPYVSGFAYVNYCDLDLPDWQHAYYGSNFKRLTQVKARHDPDDLFRFPQSIPAAK